MRFLGFLVAAVAILSACASESPPEPTLPEGSAKRTLQVMDDSFLRGVQGSYNTSPRGRDAAILDVTYTLSCLTDGAESRANQVKQALDEDFVVAPLYFNNPRERGQWRRQANREAITFGCQVTNLEYDVRTTDRLDVFLWARLNGVPPLR